MAQFTMNDSLSTAISIRAQRMPPHSTAPTPQDSLTVIVPSKTWRFLDLRELWRYRELFFFITWRDVKVRYKQTVLGGVWAILQPLLMMAAFTLIFNRVGKIDTGGIPYPVFVFAGLLPWVFFSNSISQASNSIVAGQSLVTKIYFPRVIIPSAAIGAAFFDFAVAFVMIAVLMLAYGIGISASVVFVPLLVVMLAIAAAGFAILLSGLAVAFRDVRYIIGFAMQIWLFATPSIYASQESLGLSPSMSALLAINPAQGIILNFRAAILGTNFDGISLAISCATALTMFVVAGFVFRRIERRFADVI